MPTKSFLYSSVPGTECLSVVSQTQQANIHSILQERRQHTGKTPLCSAILLAQHPHHAAFFFFSMKSSLGAGVNFQLAGSWSLPRVMQILASTGSSEPRLLTCTKYSITKLSPGSELHQIQHRWNHVHITPELGYIFPLWIMGNLLIPWIITN